MKKLFIPLACILAPVLIVVLQFGFIFLLLATLPSLVAYYVDTTPHKRAFKIVFSCNISATLPTLVPMLRASMKLKHYNTIAVLQDPNVWLYAYLGAAAGWALIALGRQIAQLIVVTTFDYAVRNLQEEQAHLAGEWGRDIAEIQ